MTRHIVLGATLLAVLACEGVEARRQRALALAESAESAGDLDRAAAILQDAIGRDPRDLAIVVRRATLELERNRPYAAERVLAALPADISETDDLRRLRARVLLRRGDCHDGIRLALALHAAGGEGELVRDEALAAVRAGFSSCQDFLGLLPREWLVRLVDLLLEDGSADRALLVWRLLPERSLERNALIERLVVGLLREPPEDVVARNPELAESPLSPARLELAHRSAVAGGRWADAAAAAATFARLFPSTSPSFEMLLATARRDLVTGKARQALAAAERALELRPAAREPLVARGLALKALGRDREARETFEALLGAEGGSAFAWQMLRGEVRERGRPGRRNAPPDAAGTHP